VGRLHSWALRCRRAGPAWWSAASSQPRDMHNYALDQTLPCCYGTMVLISRAQGLARITAAGQRTARQARPIALRPRLETARAHDRRGDRGARDNSHSDAGRHAEYWPSVSAGAASGQRASTKSQRAADARGGTAKIRRREEVEGTKYRRTRAA
jgi:hypothetical protein